jgi:glycine/D-amino acid oxidase-like deaminating enzyme
VRRRHVGHNAHNRENVPFADYRLEERRAANASVISVAANSEYVADCRTEGTRESNMLEKKPHIVVVGAGIIGAFAAYFLARSGVPVTIVDPCEIAANASGNNAGGLNPLHGGGIPGPLQELALTSMRLHLKEWDRLRRLSGIDFRGRFVTRLHVARDEGEAEELARREALHNATDGFSARWLTSNELRETGLGLSPDAIGGLWTDGNARVEPALYTRAVAESAVRLGARMIAGRARGLVTRADRVTAVRVDDENLACDGVVIAVGPWCAGPEKWLGIRLPVEAVKGELLLAEVNSPSPATEITWGPFGLYPRSARRLWLGGTEDRVGLRPGPTPTARERILGAVDSMLPALGPLRIVDHVSGLRPVTPNGLPIVGVADSHENVCLALGGGRKGMLLGPALGLASAELLAFGATAMPINGFRLNRTGVLA